MMQNSDRFYFLSLRSFSFYAMFKKIRAKLPDWRFIAFVVSNSIPGKKLLGDWRFPPIFFTAGILFEIVLCKLRINNINFCMLFVF
jgi:hypothetical protein